MDTSHVVSTSLIASESSLLSNEESIDVEDNAPDTLTPCTGRWSGPFSFLLLTRSTSRGRWARSFVGGLDGRFGRFMADLAGSASISGRCGDFCGDAPCNLAQSTTAGDNHRQERGVTDVLGFSLELLKLKDLAEREGFGHLLR